MNENELKKDMEYLLKSHGELIKALQENNRGIHEMNIILRQLVTILYK